VGDLRPSRKGQDQKAALGAAALDARPRTGALRVDLQTFFTVGLQLLCKMLLMKSEPTTTEEHLNAENT
jgi:hypothetical protein